MRQHAPLLAATIAVIATVSICTYLLLDAMENIATNIISALGR